MTAIAKIPFRPIRPSWDYRGMDYFDTFDEALLASKQHKRALIVEEKLWHTNDRERFTEDGLENPPTNVLYELYYNPTPAFVVDALRLKSLEFGAYATEVGTIASHPDGEDREFTRDGYTLINVSSAFLYGFTPLQLEIIAAWTDARP